LNPNFGIRLRSLIFQQATQDAKDQIEYTIRNGIAEWFPEVLITNLQVLEDVDNNTVSVYMKYTVTQTNIEDELLINFEQ
jgi:phage baseplate assembly protein W